MVVGAERVNEHGEISKKTSQIISFADFYFHFLGKGLTSGK